MFIPKRKHYVTIFLFFQEIPSTAFPGKTEDTCGFVKKILCEFYFKSEFKVKKKPFMILIAIFEGRLSMAFWNKRMAFFPSWQKKKSKCS